MGHNHEVLDQLRQPTTVGVVLEQQLDPAVAAS